MYATGTPSPQKEDCLKFLQTIVDGHIKAAASAEILQEILHRYRAIHRLQDGFKIYDLFRALPIAWLDILPEDVDVARELLDYHTLISSRDALHIAVMRRHRISKIITYDKGFLDIPEISVLLP